MANPSNIQWCHCTVNAIMGCGGCELFPTPSAILAELDRTLGRCGAWETGQARVVFEGIITEAWAALPVDADTTGLTRETSTTNIYHGREIFGARVAQRMGPEAGRLAIDVIRKRVKCYAATLHLNKGQSLFNPTRQANPGYAPQFEILTAFSGRVAKAARLSDMLGQNVADKPWISGLPRLVFVSDMGDQFSSEEHFEFLKAEVMQPIRSREGMRHLWLVLTKRPSVMGRFAREIGGFPPNVCAMTTVTGATTLNRVDRLREVQAPVKGLSIEPVLQHFDPADLDLAGIDWVILGGESGYRKDLLTALDLGWLRSMITHCRQQGVAVFVKQLGGRCTENGTPLALQDRHGGDWDEWPEDLRVREFPRYLHDYRRNEIVTA